MEGVGRQRLEAEPRVKLHDRIVLCLDEKRAGPNDFGSLQEAKNRVLEEQLAQTPALLRTVDR